MVNKKNTLYIAVISFVFLGSGWLLGAAELRAGENLLPKNVLVGYWHNWDNVQAPLLAPEKLHPAYNVINIAFAVPRAGTDYDMYFHPLVIKKDDFKQRIKQMQSDGKKVLISLGGGNSRVTLDSAMEKEVFVQSVLKILIDYEFDGLDIDLESSSIALTGGTIKNPVDSCVILLTQAIREIMAEYRLTFKRKAILTFAPETAYVHGGQSGFGGVWGAYLPILDALRDSIDLLQVQLYNSGSMYGLDWNVYEQATPDFVVAMIEKIILGFKTSGGFFDGFPPEKIAIGLPACNLASANGYLEVDSVALAVNYLLGKTKEPAATYKLKTAGGYPNLRGMMTWSVNWDATDSCATSYEFAQNFMKLFAPVTSVLIAEKEKPKTNSSARTPSKAKPPKLKANTREDIYFDLYPNPARAQLTIDLPKFAEPFLPLIYTIRDLNGEPVLTGKLWRLTNSINISLLRHGIYFVTTDEYTDKFIKE